MQKYAPIVVRIAVALVLLWFGTQQFLHPDMWVFLLPAWTTKLGLAPVTLIYLNSAFELIFGLALLVGFWPRTVAFIIFLHLLDIAYTVGYNDVAVRDVGLALAAFSVFLYGIDEWSIHHRLGPQSSQKA